jgi:iron complex outermembrane recepter protein
MRIGVKTCLLAGAACLAPNVASAQIAEAPAPGTQTTGVEDVSAGNPAATDDGIRDIVVTARRTEERLQQVPLAVTAIDAMAIEVRQIVEVADVGRVAPGLSVQSGGTGNASLIYLSIRGNAQNSPNSFSDPAVGIYVDDIYYARPIAGNNGLLDLAGVEVLRGTQGTLFGRNTTGGALSMTTVAPDGDFSGYVRGAYGNFKTWSVESAVNVPIVGDELAVRVAGRYGERNEGYGRNSLRQRDPATVDKDVAVRGTIAWKPEAIPLKVSVSGDYLEILETYNNVALVGINPTGPAVALYSAQFNLPSYLQTQNDFYRTYADPRTGNPNIDDQVNYNKTWGVRGTSELDLGAVRVKSITAYREADTGDSLDLDGTPAQIGAYSSDYTQNQFSQELQLTGKMGRLQWIVGGFYFRERGTEQSQSRVFAATDVGLDFAPANTNLATYESSSKALFAQANYDVTDKFTVTAGFRYTWDTRSINRMGYIGGQPGFNNSFVSGGQVITLPPTGLCQNGPNANLAPPGPLCQNPVTAKFSYPAWLLSADYKIDSEKLIYARFGGAALAGGLNARPTPPEFDSFAPEKVKDIELGFKGDFLNRRLRTNIAAFYLWRNGAQNVVNALVGANLTQFVQNAGDVRSYGIEFEGTFLPWEGMELTTGAAYLNSKYAPGSFRAAGIGGIVDRSDEIVPRAPEWTFNVGATQTFNITGGKVALHADYAYTTEIYQDFATADLTAPGMTDAQKAAAVAFINTQNTFSRLPGYGVMNARASVTLDNGFELALWGRNITGEKYYNALFNGYGTFGTAIRFQAAPRTFGATGTFRF